MNRAARRELRARKADLREKVTAQRAELRARLHEQRSADRARRSRRRRLMLLALLLLLWLLLRACHCDLEVPPPSPIEPTPRVSLLDPAPAADAIAPAPPRRAATTAPRLRGRIESTKRPEFHNETPPLQSWLTAFRMQVAARSPRLSQCFEGIEAPGALKWTAAVDTARGIVSDHQFDSVLTGAVLSKPLRECLIGVLSSPPYRLPTHETQPSPSRVSIVIEF